MTDVADDSDERNLRTRLAQGDESSFADLYDRFAPRLFRTASRLLGRRTDAEDVIQELFVALVRGRHQLLGVDNFQAYLFRSLRRRIAQRWEQQRRLPRLLGEQVDHVAARRAPSNPGEREQVDQWLNRLPDEQREVLALRIDGELTFAQIGQVLEISPNTVASRYRYGLEKLREFAQQENDRESERANRARCRDD